MSNEGLRKEFQKSFGKQLEALRKLRGLSYRQMAERCDLDHSIISKIAKGEVNIQLSTILQLAKSLGINAKELFDFNFDADKE